MTLDPAIARALMTDRVVDITTTGRTSGAPRRIETWIYQYDGRVYLYGSPGKRDWVANLLANPALTIHLKNSVKADIPARATWVDDPAHRQAAITHFFTIWNVDEAERPHFLAGSPLMVLDIQGLDPPR
jgi:deazaflavin-dependent oxidoreductase (nitroreductase family)